MFRTQGPLQRGTGVQGLLADLALIEIPKPGPRTMVASPADVAPARKAARAHGAPSRALAYAIPFETALRQLDVTGQWYELDFPVISGTIVGARKWVGLEWKHIEPDLLLRYTPSKTEDTSQARIVIGLKLCPMVIEELALVPEEARQGPVIVDEQTGSP